MFSVAVALRVELNWAWKLKATLFEPLSLNVWMFLAFNSIVDLLDASVTPNNVRLFVAVAVIVDLFLAYKAVCWLG